MVIGSRQILHTARLLLAAALLQFAVAPAWAGELRIKLVDPKGRPIADAVVSLRPQNGPVPRPSPRSGSRISQKDMQFHPFVTVVPVGSTVSFPNLDPFRHHVYSFSPTKRFELKLFARDETRSITLDKAGIVAIGCNIHDNMSAFIFVTDTPWTVLTGPDGTALFRDTPGGVYSLQAWHPFLRAPGETLSVARQGGPDRAETITVRLRSPPMQGMGGY